MDGAWWDGARRVSPACVTHVDARLCCRGERPLGDLALLAQPLERAPVVAQRAYIVELIGILANSASTVLGVLNLATWAPVTVAIAT